MRRYTRFFFTVAAVSAVLSLPFITGFAAGYAMLVCLTFIVLGVISLFVHEKPSGKS